MLPVLSVLAVFPEAVLAVFGMAGVDNGPEALRLATLAALAGLLLGHADNLLLMAGRSRTVLYDTIPALVILVVGTSSLLGVWGLLGAAIAWIGSAWTYRLAAMIQARKLHGGWLIDRPLGTEVALVASSSLAIGWCLRLISGSSIVAAATAGLIGSLGAMARLLLHQPSAVASPPPQRQASVSARTHG
jgi:O-antigen/teichoic acid export membrane protein